MQLDFLFHLARLAGVMARWVRARRGRPEPAPSPAAKPWVLGCTPRVPLTLSDGTRLKAGRHVSLPAMQAVALHRSGKVQLDIEIANVFGGYEPGQPRRPRPPMW